MKIVILAGGLGTRLSEETEIRPKPMVEIGGRPILWHIMKHYAHFGVNEFFVALGYKGEVIKDFFRNYLWMTSDITMKLGRNADATFHTHHDEEDWTVTLADTGEETMTGGRLKRIRPLLGDETFCMTYGDGVADVDIHALLEFHRTHRKLVTVTAVQPTLPFGVINFHTLAGGTVGFEEKPRLHAVWVNSGFFVIEPRALDVISGDDEAWENGPLEHLAHDGQLAAFRHEGFWHCMDTPKDRQVLEDLWKTDRASWKLW